MGETEKTTFDVIIVGGGPAGLCAALYGGRGMLDTLLIERGMPGGELLNTDLIEDYIGFASVKGPELAQLMTEHAKKFGANIVMDTVDLIEKQENGAFRVTTQLGKEYRAPAVIVTAGGTPRKLGVPGEQEYAGRAAIKDWVQRTPLKRQVQQMSRAVKQFGDITGTSWNQIGWDEDTCVLVSPGTNAVPTQKVEEANTLVRSFLFELRRFSESNILGTVVGEAVHLLENLDLGYQWRP